MITRGDKHKRWELRRHRKEKQILHKRRKRDVKRQLKYSRHQIVLTEKNREDKAIVAPEDFRLLENVDFCCQFFKQVRKTAHDIVRKSFTPCVRVDFRNVKFIDFASARILYAIGDDLKNSTPKCAMRGFLPKNKSCRKFLQESGFLEDKVNELGIPFSPSTSTKNMSIAYGQTKWTDEDGREIAAISKKTYEHILAADGNPTFISENLKEICGNSVEWSNSNHVLWYTSAKFTNDSVEYVALDLGEGILKTIHRDFIRIIKNLNLQNNLEILEAAFDKKHFSHSKDINRHKGLPRIKSEFLSGRFLDLKVLTNDVYLDFSDSTKNVKIRSKNEFDGTLYRWIIKKDSFSK